MRLSGSDGLYRVVRGQGPGLVLVHGTGADADSWLTQLATLKDCFRVLAYDRRGTSRSPPEGLEEGDLSIEAHAGDLLDLVARTFPEEQPLVVGSSFGAVCVLEAARRAPDAFRGMMLMEPPLPESDEAPPFPESFLARFEHIEQAQGSAAAADFFLRALLGRAAFEALPRYWRARASALHAQIRWDSRALMDYPLQYGDLIDVRTPTVLIGGGRSAPYFRATLHALNRSLPVSRVEMLKDAGHMLDASVASDFRKCVLEFSHAWA